MFIFTSQLLRIETNIFWQTIYFTFHFLFVGLPKDIDLLSIKKDEVWRKFGVFFDARMENTICTVRCKCVYNELYTPVSKSVGHYFHQRKNKKLSQT